MNLIKTDFTTFPAQARGSKRPDGLTIFPCLWWQTPSCEMPHTENPSPAAIWCVQTVAQALLLNPRRGNCWGIHYALTGVWWSLWQWKPLVFLAPGPYSCSPLLEWRWLFRCVSPVNQSGFFPASAHLSCHPLGQCLCHFVSWNTEAFWRRLFRYFSAVMKQKDMVT